MNSNTNGNGYHAGSKGSASESERHSGPSSFNGAANGANGHHTPVNVAADFAQEDEDDFKDF